jgi:acetyl esterase/lipase
MPDPTPGSEAVHLPRAARDAAGAASRTAAEKASAFAHPPVAPEATAAYGQHPDQVIDFYRPRGARPGRPAPLVVLFHGGAWREPYDRRHLSPLAAYLAGHGLAIASVEYRRGAASVPVPAPASAPVPESAAGPGAGRWPETLDDAAAAVDAAPALAVAALGEQAVDPRRVVLAGHSAGGQLALWAAARHVLPPDSRWHSASPPPLRGVVALAPIADFGSAIRLRVCSGAVVEFLGGPEHAETRQSHADPAMLLPTGIAVTIVQGTTDNDVPPQVAEAFAAASALAGEEVQLTLLEATGHFPLIDPSAEAAAVVAEEIAQLAW